MFYIIKDEKLQLASDDREKLNNTLEFMTQLKDERVLETDIVTAKELELHPNKVIVSDIEIEIDVSDYETVTKETEVPVYKNVSNEELDEEGNVIETYFTQEIDHIETMRVETEVQIGSHKEVITVKGLVLNPNYEKEEKEKEREHVKSLTCTKRVFALMLQELDITYGQLKELIASNEQAELEWDLCVELQRSNPLLDLMAMQLGVTSEQLDKLFQYANGEITLEEFKIANTEDNSQDVTD